MTNTQIDDIVTKHFIQYFRSEPFNINNWDVEVNFRDIETVKIDRHCDGFLFYDLSEIRVGDKLFQGEKENYSNKTYFGKLMTTTEFYENFPRRRDEAEQAIKEGYGKIVIAKSGGVFGIREGDVIIDKEGWTKIMRNSGVMIK